MSSNTDKTTSVIGSLPGAGTGDSVSGTSGRRMSSTTASGGMFGGLMDQKRHSADATAQARRTSLVEHKTVPGFLGGLWNSVVRGEGK